MPPARLLGRSVLALALLGGPLHGAGAPRPTGDATAKARGAGAPVTVVAAGDIACAPTDPSYNGGAGVPGACQQRATSDLALSLQPAAALLLGDLQYDVGALDAFRQSFDPSWGRLRGISYPAIGNHEYYTPGALGYRTYFGSRATPQGVTWYGFDLGGWHLVALDANCGQVGGCGAGSAQLAWLRADLAAHPDRCTLAFWHEPRFSSGPHGSDATYVPFWQALQAAGADLVLAGHDHEYERFAPQDALGGLDRVTGIRELVAGTGGKVLYTFTTHQANSEQRRSAFGVLALQLYPLGYTFRFVPIDGSPGDAGGGLCHAAWPGPMPDYHPLPRCRAADVRFPWSGGAGARQTDDVALRGVCGVPAGAAAVTADVTATAAGPTRLRVYAAGGAPPAAPTLLLPGGTTAGASLLQPLGVHGMLTFDASTARGGPLRLVVDVTGYFQ